MEWYLIVYLGALLMILKNANGALYLRPDKHPGIIHADAPSGLTVIHMVGYDNETGANLTGYGLTGKDVVYFQIDTSGVIQTAKTIDKPVDHMFSFLVFAYQQATQVSFAVAVLVIPANQYPPVFQSEHYDFIVYRNARNKSSVGAVKAADNDTGQYNSMVNYFEAADDSTDYFLVDKGSGYIVVERDLPEVTREVNFTVVARDLGSPSLSSTASVTVLLSDIASPSIMGFMVRAQITRICWKNPTGSSFVERYILRYNVEGDDAYYEIDVVINSNALEICTTTDLDPYLTYLIYIRIFIGSERSPTSLFRAALAGNGTYGQWETFNYCNMFIPCENNATCHGNSSDNYRCGCNEGWQGVHCTERDLCPTIPCQNGGTCTFVSHETVLCDCDQEHYGDFCQFYNLCLQMPCDNNGTCVAMPDGNYTCQCPDYFRGDICEIPDPCKPSGCGNGNCIQLSNTKFECECYKGYRSEFCDYHNICILLGPNLCTSQGECLDVANGTYVCHCQVGLTGRHCTILDICGMGWCMNNSTCQSYADGTYRCFCQPGFSGQECQIFDPCLKIPCKHNGECSSDANMVVTCSCKPGTSGEFCEFIDPCYTNPCNNNGTCVDISDKINEEYVCTCVDGFYGPNCDDFNPCVDVPCHYDQPCANISNSEFSCSCSPYYLGDLCQDINPCYPDPCLNGVRCLRINDTHHSCPCVKNFFGDRCEKYDFCIQSSICSSVGNCTLNGLGRSPEDVRTVIIEGNGPANGRVNASVSNWYQCSCPVKYAGDNCELHVPSCHSGPCENDGLCVETDTSYRCECTLLSKGLDCEIPLYCASEPCLNGGICVELGNSFRCDCTEDYAGLHCENEAGAAAALKKLTALKALTSDPSKLGPDDISNVTGILEDVFSYSLASITVAEVLTDVISNVMNVNASVLKTSNAKNKSSERMVGMLDDYTANAIVTEGNISLATENIHLTAVNYDRRITPKGDITYTPHLLKGNDTVDSEITFTLSEEVLAPDGNDSSEVFRIQFVTFDNANFFIEAGEGNNTILMNHTTRVISASIKGRPSRNLTQPIVYVIPNIVAGRSHQCMYWNTLENKWSTDGLVTFNDSADYTECHAYHMTSFSILMDPTPDQAIPYIHVLILDIITYIGCGVSMVGLALTMLTYALFKCLHGEKSGKILLNLCASMFLLNAVFVMGSQSQGVMGSEICFTVAVLLHYLLLTTVMWMCVESFNMYQLLVTVFAKYSGHFMLKRCVVAWGLPVLVVAITMGVSLDNYRSKSDYCFISHCNVMAFYIALLAPACLVFLVNIVVFIMVARVILKPRFQGQVGCTSQVTGSQVRGAFTVMVLLGITWIFGPFAIDEAKLVFNYLFTILNVIQGFLIFVFRCFLNAEARMAWIQLIKTGTFKKKRGTGKSTSDTSSKAENSRLNASTGTNGYSSSAVSKGKLSTNMENNSLRRTNRDLNIEVDPPSKHAYSKPKIGKINHFKTKSDEAATRF